MRERCLTAERVLAALRAHELITVYERGANKAYLRLGIFSGGEAAPWIEVFDPLRDDWRRVGRMPVDMRPVMWLPTDDLLVEAARRLFNRYLLRGKLPETASIWRITP
jgi:hypothetical protein